MPWKFRARFPNHSVTNSLIVTNHQALTYTGHWDWLQVTTIAIMARKTMPNFVRFMICCGVFPTSCGPTILTWNYFRVLSWIGPLSQIAKFSRRRKWIEYIEVSIIWNAASEHLYRKETADDVHKWRRKKLWWEPFMPEKDAALFVRWGVLLP